MLARILRAIFALEVLAAALVAGWLATARDWPLAGAIAAGIAAPLLAHAAIVALNFVLAAIAGGATPPRLAIGPTAVLRVYLRELLDSIAVFQWRMPWLAGRALAGEGAAPGDARSRIPVVLVHGYVCNRQLWRPFAAWLAARGHAIEAVDLEPVFGSIDDYAPLIARAASRLRERTGARRIGFVCHSMGGLAARAYLRASGDANVGCVVTLGTPHRGTVHARFGHGANARQMRRDSEWLRALASGESPAQLRKFTVVLTHHDNVVVPRAIQTLPGARTVELAGVGHLTLAFEREAWEAAAAALDAAR